MKILHVDVFSKGPFSGNGLTVVFVESVLSQEMMQQIACEFKQFETIFLMEKTKDTYEARIFTTQEELDFAGHPILGAAAVVHSEKFQNEMDKAITFQLAHKEVVTNSKKMNQGYEVVMNQGVPVWGKEVSQEWRSKYCEALNLKLEDLCHEYPMEVVSTGLPYLLVPVKSGQGTARITSENFEELLAENDAKFTYIFDIARMEGRTWENYGGAEDVATGSAAGPMGAYLYKHSVYNKSETIVINQGSYLNRPSIIKVSCNEGSGEILVSGHVTILSKGELYL